jgi:hypothetical protein
MRRLLTAAVFALVASCGGAAGAQASCAVTPGSGPTLLAAAINAAPIVFVGIVVGTASNDRVARVRVESIWKGPVIPTLVTVSGTPDQVSAATSVDRTFKVGRRYLFVPFAFGTPIQDNSCSATQEYSSQVAGLQPATVQSPAPGTDGPDPTASGLSVWLWAAAGGLLLAGAVLALTGLRRLRRRSAGSNLPNPG